MAASPLAKPVIGDCPAGERGGDSHGRGADPIPRVFQPPDLPSFKAAGFARPQA